MRETIHRIMYGTANYSTAMKGISIMIKIIPFTPWWDIRSQLLWYCYSIPCMLIMMLMIGLIKEKYK